MNTQPPSEFQEITHSAGAVLNELSLIINDWAEKKGWNEGEDSIQHKSSDIALMHSELSECLEFVRTRPTHRKCNVCGDIQEGTKTEWCEKCPMMTGLLQQLDEVFDDHVPAITGEAAELADVLIRIFHYCGRRGINLGEAVRLKHEYNITRPYKHGKNL